ncbi:MAG: hypothetical protein MSG64_07385 [Pyrinomonadaceae bacterium MAG19_C2-C3]|nr:hypothetical protein [Pyrinomonadaceae bacterium MAG19_C2-C3]
MIQLTDEERENRRLWKVKERAEKIYQGRHRVHDEDARSNIYHDIIMLGHALKVVDGQMSE